MRRAVVLDLVLTNQEVLLGNVKLKGSLHCNDHEMSELKIVRTTRKVHRKFAIINLRRADFGLFRLLLDRVP